MEQIRSTKFIELIFAILRTGFTPYCSKNNKDPPFLKVVVNHRLYVLGIDHLLLRKVDP